MFACGSVTPIFCISFCEQPAKVIQYPMKVARPGGVNFVKRWNFMFARFNPSAYYFAFVLNTRNLFIGLIPVPRSRGEQQR